MKAIITKHTTYNNTTRIEYYGEVYNDANQLIETNALLATIIKNGDKWDWHVGIQNNGPIAANKGTCLSEAEAQEKMYAYINQG